MFVRLLCSGLLLVIFSAAAQCRCPNDPIPPDVIQLRDEIAAPPPSFVVRELHLVNVIHATVDEQRQIETSLAGICITETGNLNELSERIRDTFQQRGFFKAQISALTTEAPDSSVDPPTVSVAARVDEGLRYRLKGITFTGNRAIVNNAILRDQFPMKDGEIFNTSNVREGLENLRKLYGEGGYINFTPVPDTKIDDERRLIALNIDMDEGKAFRIKSFRIEGANAQQENALEALWMEMFRPGDIFNTRLAAEFLVKVQTAHLLPPNVGPEGTFGRRLNEAEGAVDLVLKANEQRIDP
jgi:outer membrane protein insertion porin family